MAFNNLYSAEKRFLMNPKDLGFTQANIKSTFADPTHRSVRETASLLCRGLLSPNVFAPLHVCIDEQGNMWSDNNRRLFALRLAGVDCVPVVFDGTRRPINSLKTMLSDPAFMPRIRGEVPARVRIPPPPTSVQNVYQLQNEPEPSLPGSVSAERQTYSRDEGDDEIEASFAQLAIDSTSTAPTEIQPFYPASQAEHRGFVSESEASRVRIPPQPTSGGNVFQMENEASLLDSDSSGYSKRQYHSVHYEYSYAEDGTLKDANEAEYCLSSLFHEAQDEVEYCHFPCPEEYDDDTDSFW